MRVNRELSYNTHRSYREIKHDVRMKRNNYRHDDHHVRSERNALKSHYRPRDDYSSLNRSDVDGPNYYKTTNQSVSSGFEPETKSSYFYPSEALEDQCMLSNRLNTVRNLPLESQQSRYSPPVPSYRRDRSHRYDQTTRISRTNDSYIRNEYSTQGPTSSTIYNTVESYDDPYRSSDFNKRPQPYDIDSNRNSSSRPYRPMTSSPSYRISSLPVLSSSSSSYITHDPYAQSYPLPSTETDYRMRDYGTSMDHRLAASNKSSDRYDDSNYSSSSYCDRSNLKRSRSSFNESNSKRSMRRHDY